MSIPRILPASAAAFALLAALAVAPFAPAAHAADDAPAPPGQPAAPPPPEPPPTPEAQVRAAEAKARRAEIEFVQAQIELEQARSQRVIAPLQARLEAAQAALVALEAPGPEEGWVRSWLVLGPIPAGAEIAAHDEATCKPLFARWYVQPTAAPKAGDTVKVNGDDLAWSAIEAPNFFAELSKVAEAAGKPAENALYLGVAYVTCPEVRTDVRLSIGSDDDSAWRLNGTEVVRAYAGRAVDRDQDKSEPLALKAGVNVLTFTVLNGDGPAAAAARFLDKDGKPIADLTVSTTPPPTAVAAPEK